MRHRIQISELPLRLPLLFSVISFLGVSTEVWTYKYTRKIHKFAFVLSKNHEEICIHYGNSIGIRGTSCMDTGLSSFLSTSTETGRTALEHRPSDGLCIFLTVYVCTKISLQAINMYWDSIRAKQGIILRQLHGKDCKQFV